MDFSDAAERNRVVSGRERGYVFVPAGTLALGDGAARQLAAIQALMDEAPADPFDPYANRSRYHCQLILDPATRSLHNRKGVGYWRAAHLGYEYSGEERRFAPVPDAILGAPLFLEWVWFWFDLLPVALFPPIALALVEVHLMRTRAGPAIANQFHKDGEPFFVLSLIGSRNVENAITQVARDPEGQHVVDRFVLAEPLDSLLVDDRMVFHNVTPFRPADESQRAYRDVLNLGYIPLVPGGSSLGVLPAAVGGPLISEQEAKSEIRHEQDWGHE